MPLEVTQNLLFTLETCHSSQLGILSDALVHHKCDLDIIYFILLNQDKGILISQNNLTAYLENQSSNYRAFTILSTDAPALLHLIDYNMNDENRVTIKDIYTDHYLCASPLQSGEEYKPIEARHAAGVWEIFNLIEQSSPKKLVNLIGKLLINLRYGIQSKIESSLEPLILDILINYQPIVYLGSYLNQAKQWIPQLKSIYKKGLYAPLFLQYHNQSLHYGHTPYNINFDSLLPVSSYKYGDHTPVILNVLERSQYKPSKKSCVLAVARNEGIYLLEFVAFYRALGVDHIFIYSNNNEDGSDELLHALANSGFITYINNHSLNSKPQYNAYGHALSINRDILEYEWTIVVDIDEFIVLNPERYNNITSFLDYHNRLGCDLISINWKMMSPNQQLYYKSDLLMDRFPYGILQPLVKSIVRTNKTFQSHAHYALIPKKLRGIRRHADGSFFSSNKFGDSFTDHLNGDHAVCQHYYYKSLEEFIAKKSRNTGDQNIEYSIDFKLLNYSQLKSFFDKFKLVEGMSSLQERDYYRKKTIHQLNILLENITINLCQKKIINNYKNMQEIYKKKFIKYISKDKNLYKLVMDFLQMTPNASAMF